MTLNLLIKNTKISNILLLLALLLFAIAGSSLVAVEFLKSISEPKDFSAVNAETTIIPPTQSLSLAVSNNINTSLPRDGGTILGEHDLTVRTTNVFNGYSLTLATATTNNKLINNTNSNKTINPTTNTKAKPGALQNNTWGYSVSERNNITNFNPTTYSQVLPSNTTNISNKQIANTDINSTANRTGLVYDTSNSYINSTITDVYRVAYATRVDNPSLMLGGIYEYCSICFDCQCYTGADYC